MQCFHSILINGALLSILSILYNLYLLRLKPGALLYKIPRRTGDSPDWVRPGFWSIETLTRIPVYLLYLFIPLFAALRLQSIRPDLSFIQAVLHCFGILMLYHLTETVFMDLLVLSIWKPSSVYSLVPADRLQYSTQARLVKHLVKAAVMSAAAAAVLAAITSALT